MGGTTSGLTIGAPYTGYTQVVMNLIHAFKTQFRYLLNVPFKILLPGLYSLCPKGC